MNNEATEKLFDTPYCPDWVQGGCILQWRNEETKETGEGAVWVVWVGPFGCELSEIPNNVRAQIYWHGSKDFTNREEALAWLRTKILKYRDEANLATIPHNPLTVYEGL
jgi:hypothetical protein